VRSKKNLLGGASAPLVVTGAGLVTAAGRGVEVFREALSAGKSFLEPLADEGPRAKEGPRARQRFDPGSFGGRVDDAILQAWGGLEPGDDRAVPLGALAMDEALEAADLSIERRPAHRRIGLVLGTALGAAGSLEEDPPAPPSFSDFARRLAAIAGAREPACSFSVTCVSGLAALEQAAADIALERVPAVLAGGVDTLSGFMHGGFSALKALSPSGRLRPFDMEHDGIVIGEAAAFIVLESLAAARERGAKPLAAVVSQRIVSDALHPTSPDVSGRGMALAIRGALEDAGIPPGAVGCITVTAAGSAACDRMQSLAVETALGEPAARRVPVTTWEASTGHVLAATGVLGIIHAAMVLEDGRVLPGPRAARIDPSCRLAYVLGEPVPLESPWVLALTVGFGGQNGATLVASVEAAADLPGRVRGESP
jgi:3-oxoacyl-(acyl-carrier-protein) synthase